MPANHFREPMNAATANILVVDDDQRLRDLLNRYLAEQGFGVLTTRPETRFSWMNGNAVPIGQR